MADLDALQSLLGARCTRRDFAEAPLSRRDVETLLSCGLGDSRNDRKVVPSAGALYPMRLLLVAGAVEGLEPGLHGWSAGDGLGPLLQPGDLRPALQKAALEEQPWVGRAAALVIIAADIDSANAAFHEQQPDGRRGERYAAMEAGAIAQSLYLATEALSLAGVLVGGIDDAATAGILNLPGGLTPIALFACGPRTS
jgi:SagB-type dehydrogenase family enzyme